MLVSVRRGARPGSSRARVAHFITLFVAVTALACHGEAAEARRADVARVAEAVRKLRDAPNDEKRPLLLALQQTPCAADDAVKLRKSCSDAYGLQVTALDAVAAVRHAAQGNAPLPPEAAELLARSEADLKRAAQGTTACADLESDLKRRYAIP